LRFLPPVGWGFSCGAGASDFGGDCLSTGDCRKGLAPKPRRCKEMGLGQSAEGGHEGSDGRGVRFERVPVAPTSLQESPFGENVEGPSLFQTKAYHAPGAVQAHGFGDRTLAAVVRNDLTPAAGGYFDCASIWRLISSKVAWICRSVACRDFRTNTTVIPAAATSSTGQRTFE